MHHRDEKQHCERHHDYIKAEGGPRLLLITWNAYERLPRHLSFAQWMIFIDELPQLDHYRTLTLTDNKHLLLDHVCMEPGPDDSLGCLQLTNAAKTKDFLDQPRDDANDLARDILYWLYSGTRDVYVDSASWQRIMEEDTIGDDDKENTIHVLAMLNETTLVGTTLIGANIDDSILKKYLETHCSTHFSEHPVATKLTRTISKRDNATIHYFLSRRHISKSFATKLNSAEVRRIDEMDRVAADHFGDKRFLYVCNNDRHSEILDNLKNCKRIPVICHGSNEYLDFCNIYASLSLNRKPKQIKMLNALGLSHDDIQKASAHEIVYQCVLRTRLRVPGSTDKVEIIVPDKFTADRIGELTGISDIRRIGSIEEDRALLAEGATSKIERKADIARVVRK